MARTPQRPQQRRNGGTAQALLDAAEEHFAADGFDRASLRAVMRAAGADPGSVHYHFGGRPALVGAVLDRLLAPLNARRLELLDRAQAEHGDGSVPLAELVAALIRPDLEVVAALDQKGSGRGRLVGAIYLHPAAFVTERVEAHFAPVAARFLPPMVVAAPGVDPQTLAWRVRWLLFGTLGALLSDEAEPLRYELDALVGRLASDLAAALAQPGTMPPPATDRPSPA